MVMNRYMIWEPADDAMAARYGRREVEFVRWGGRENEDEAQEVFVRLLDQKELVIAYEDELRPRPVDLPMIVREELQGYHVTFGRCRKTKYGAGYHDWIRVPSWGWKAYMSDPGIEPFGPFVKGYVECMIWASNTDGFHTDEGNAKYEIHDGLDWDDLSVECRASVIEDCRGFMQLCKEAELDLTCYPGKSHNDSLAYAGHDFWLTRNGHGAGFWDGDWPRDGKDLTEWAKTFGGQHLYVGDDGLVYVL